MAIWREAPYFCRCNWSGYKLCKEPNGSLWGVMLALQAFSGIHTGIDKLNVLGGVARLIDRGPVGTPLLPLSRMVLSSPLSITC